MSFFGNTFEPGVRILDRYTILDKIRTTQMSILYKARDEVQGMDVCLKFPPPAVGSDKRSAEIIKNEFLNTTKLNHENIVKTYKFEVVDGQPFFVMEYLDGKNLEDILHEMNGLSMEGQEKPAKLPYDKIYSYARQIASALLEAHSEKIVHRDLKTSNVIVDASGHLKVVDFGIARIVKDTFTKLTSEGSSGTHVYMAPEQLKGKTSKVGASSDWYSFGIMLYEMVAGQPPFTIGDLTYQHLNEIPPDITTAKQDCPAALAQLIMRMLEKDPDIRQKNIQYFVDTIEALSTNDQARIEQATSEYDNSPSASEKEEPKKRFALPRVPALAAGVGTLILILSTGVLAWNSWQKGIDIERLTRDLRSREKQMADAGLEVKSLDNTLTTTQKTLQSTASQLQTTSKTLEEREQALQQREQQLREREAQLSSARADNRQKGNEISNLESQNNSLSTQLSQANEEKSRLRSSVRSLEQDLESSKSNYTRVSNSLDSYKSSNADLRSSVERWKSEYTDVYNKNQRLVSIAKEFAEENERLANQLNNLWSRFSTAHYKAYGWYPQN